MHDAPFTRWAVSPAQLASLLWPICHTRSSNTGTALFTRPCRLPTCTLVQDTIARLHEMIATIESRQLPSSAHDLIATLGELEDEQATPAAEIAG